MKIASSKIKSPLFRISIVTVLFLIAILMVTPAFAFNCNDGCGEQCGGIPPLIPPEPTCLATCETWKIASNCNALDQCTIARTDPYYYQQKDVYLHFQEEGDIVDEAQCKRIATAHAVLAARVCNLVKPGPWCHASEFTQMQGDCICAEMDWSNPPQMVTSTFQIPVYAGDSVHIEVERPLSATFETVLLPNNENIINSCSIDGLEMVCNREISQKGDWQLSLRAPSGAEFTYTVTTFDDGVVSNKHLSSSLLGALIAIIHNILH